MALSPALREARCRHLVDTAHMLIRETGDTGFSMVELARRAGVSPATPYNLLGSKGEVLRRVIRDEFARFASLLGAQSAAPPFAHLLRALDLVAVQYLAEPQFYRGLYGAVLGAEASPLRAMMGEEGQMLWTTLVEAAMAEGDIVGLLDAPRLTALLLRTVGATVEAWLAEDWSAERFGPELTLATRTVLLGLVSPAQAPALKAALMAAQAALAEDAIRPACPSAPD